MIKDFLLIHPKVSRAPAVLHYRDYVKQVHVPRAMSNPAIAREMRTFNLNYLVYGKPCDLCLFPPRDGLDTVVEHKLGGWEAMQRVMTDPEYLAVVRPCEEYMNANVFESLPQFVVIEDEREVFSCDTPGTARMFDFVRRANTLTHDEFLARLEEDGVWAAADPDYRAAVCKRVHSEVGQGDPPFGAAGDPFDAVIEVWIDDAAKFGALSTERKERLGAICDPDRSFSAMTEQHRVV